MSRFDDDDRRRDDDRGGGRDRERSPERGDGGGGGGGGKGGGGGRFGRNEDAKLYVGGLSFTTRYEDLQREFERFGAVSDCFLPKDSDTGQNRGFGFVTFETVEQAEEAIRGCASNALFVMKPNSPFGAHRSRVESLGHLPTPDLTISCVLSPLSTSLSTARSRRSSLSSLAPLLLVCVRDRRLVNSQHGWQGV